MLRISVYPLYGFTNRIAGRPRFDHANLPSFCTAFVIDCFTFQLSDVNGNKTKKNEPYYISSSLFLLLCFLNLYLTMYKKVFNVMVLMITVLSVNLITGWLTDYIIHYKLGINPYKFTAIAMLALVFILVPAYSYLGKQMEYLIVKVLLSGSSSFGKIVGLLFSFAVIFGILFLLYLKEWFHISLLMIMKEKIF